MEMECELLISNFKNPKTIDLVNDNIGSISDGSSSHSANALKLGLKKAFDLKKSPHQNCTKLRCSSSYCGWNSGSGISYSSVGLYCGSCNSYMKCVSCGYQRTSNYSSCQSCGKSFV